MEACHVPDFGEQRIELVETLQADQCNIAEVVLKQS